jgi:hypothetical protein
MSVRPASHHVEGDADVLLGDLFWGERAVGPPPRRQRRAHGDDGAGGRVGVVGAEPSVAHGVLHLVVDHALLHGAQFGDLLTVGGFEAAHLAAANEP